jgi:hypothetical protein
MNISKSEALFRRAVEKIPGGVNSPVRAFRSVGGQPLFIARGEGAYLYDADGNRYIDYVGSWGPLLLGHRHPEILAALERALAIGTSFGAPTEQEIDLAEAIMDAVPSIEMVRLVNSGTEATMSAIRVARGFTGRDLIVKFEGCYHGHVDSLLVKAGSGMATLGIADTQGVPRAFAETTLALPYNSLAAVESAFGAHGDRIAAVIVEPVVGNMGCVPPLPGYLEVRHPSGPDDARQGDRRRTAGGRVRRAQERDEQGRAGGPGVSGGDAVWESAGGRGGPRHAAASQSASRGVRRARSARRAPLRGRARGSDGEPGGIDVHVLLHRRSGDRLGQREEERHGALRPLLPRHAGTRRVPGAFAVRGGVSERGALG